MTDTDETDLDRRYKALNTVERQIVRNFRKDGCSLKEAIERLYSDLDDAAEEDGYDGP